MRRGASRGCASRRQSPRAAWALQGARINQAAALRWPLVCLSPMGILGDSTPRRLVVSSRWAKPIGQTHASIYPLVVVRPKSLVSRLSLSSREPRTWKRSSPTRAASPGQPHQGSLTMEASPSEIISRMSSSFARVAYLSLLTQRGVDSIKRNLSGNLIDRFASRGPKRPSLAIIHSQHFAEPRRINISAPAVNLTAPRRLFLSILEMPLCLAGLLCVVGRIYLRNDWNTMMMMTTPLQRRWAHFSLNLTCLGVLLIMLVAIVGRVLHKHSKLTPRTSHRPPRPPRQLQPNSRHLLGRPASSI